MPGQREVQAGKQTRARACDTLFFDLYGTLADIHTDETRIDAFRLMAQHCAAFGARWTPEQLCRAYAVRRAEALQKAKAQPGWTEPDFAGIFSGFLAEKGAQPTESAVVDIAWAFRRGTTEYLRLYPGAAEFLHCARQAGYKCVLVSNAQSLYTRPELKKLGLDAMLDTVCISSEAGCKKPDTRFYRYAVEQSGALPARTLMVGNDALCDIGGGHGAGLHTAYFHTNLSPAEDPACPPQADMSFEGADFAALARAMGLL